MPDIHVKKGTHLWFNTPKAGGIKFGFYCKDKDFVEEVMKRNSEEIETYSNGVRMLGNPKFDTVQDAINASESFIKILINR